MFSDLIPDLGEGEGYGFANSVANQLGMELQMTNNEFAGDINVLDVPFWMTNDQWKDMSGTS